MPESKKALFEVTDSDQGGWYDTYVDMYPPIDRAVADSATEGFSTTTEWVCYDGYPNGAVQRHILLGTDDYPEADVLAAVDGLRRLHEEAVRKNKG